MNSKEPRSSCKMNPSMASLLQSSGRPAAALDSGLRSYISSGLQEEGGALVSVAARSAAHEEQCRFHDLTAFEGFVNKIHLDDWLSEAWNGSLSELLEQALALADEIGRQAADLEAEIEVAISCDISAEDVVFRFYRIRETEAAWVNDVDTLEEPALLKRYQTVASSP